MLLLLRGLFVAALVVSTAALTPEQEAALKAAKAIVAELNAEKARDARSAVSANLFDQL